MTRFVVMFKSSQPSLSHDFVTQFKHVIIYLRLIRECVLLPEAPLPFDPVPHDETDLAVSSLCSRNGGSTMEVCRVL